jgi:L-asparaginase
MSVASLPQVSVLALGGTIAMISSAKGAILTLGADELLAAVPPLGGIARVHEATFRQVPSAHLSLADIVALAARIEREFAGGADGVVITQGTDTIEEVAFALDLLVRAPGPVVVTGAMRVPDCAGADGAANILAAVQAAASPALRGLGCVVVIGDDIHAARFVLKQHTASPAAFGSPLTGRIGWVTEGRATIALLPFTGILPELPSSTAPGRVALVTASLGDDGGGVRAAIKGGYDGLVIEGLGGGHLPAAMLEPLDDAVAAMPVVLASRTQVGELLRTTYGFPGSERDLFERGLLSAGWLNARKARILLSLLVGAADDVAESLACYLSSAVARA